MSEKKRKRSSTGADVPRKKVNLDSSIDQIKLVHVPKDDNWCPILASTSGISIASKISLQAYRKRIQSSRNQSRDELLLHSSQHPKLDYTARCNDKDVSGRSLNHYVGVFNPESGELQIVEARHMSIRSTLRSEEGLTKEDSMEEKPKLTSRQELQMAFGTKKVKKAIESITENGISPHKARDASPSAIRKAIKANPVATAVLESMAASAMEAPTKATMQAATDDAKPRPKHNADATEVEEIYPLETLIGNEVMAECKVKPWVDATMEKRELKISSRYVAHRLNSVVEEDDVPKLKALRYLLFLLDFYSAVKGQGGKRGKLPKRDVMKEKMDGSSYMLDAVRMKFSTGDELTKWHVDYLITHAAVLSLVIDDFETDTHDLREDLGLKPVEMRNYFREVGANMALPTEKERMRSKMNKAEASMHSIARLTLPPNFPKQRLLPVTRRR